MMDVAEEKLSCYRVGSLPTVYYVPDFITDTDQTFLLNNIYGVNPSRWKPMKNRRLQNLGGIVHEKGLLPQPLPSWLTNLTKRMYEESGLFPSPINHVLINEYQPNQGIMPHQDGPAYFPVVAILSLGSPAVMDFTPHARLKLDSEDVTDEDSGRGTSELGKDKWLDDHHAFSVLLMPRSLLIFKDQAYSDYLHSIQDSAVHCYDGVVNETEALKYKESDGHHCSSEEAMETAGTEELLRWALGKLNSGLMEGGSVSRPPILDGSNYDYWKAHMVAFLKSLDSKTWKTIVKGWKHPVIVSVEGKSTTDLKPEEQWTKKEDEEALRNPQSIKRYHQWS